mmetsp:Transcript_70321/g.110027  ORF Transcript_70321/g.110027 Transcript_70321/m.110027 type:complete len:218 (-) Transcript_70321:650-1303(-)
MLTAPGAIPGGAMRATGCPSFGGISTGKPTAVEGGPGALTRTLAPTATLAAWGSLGGGTYFGPLAILDAWTSLGGNTSFGPLCAGPGGLSASFGGSTTFGPRGSGAGNANCCGWPRSPDFFSCAILSSIVRILPMSTAEGLLPVTAPSASTRFSTSDGKFRNVSSARESILHSSAKAATSSRSRSLSRPCGFPGRGPTPGIGPIGPGNASGQPGGGP